MATLDRGAKWRRFVEETSYMPNRHCLSSTYFPKLLKKFLKLAAGVIMFGLQFMIESKTMMLVVDTLCKFYVDFM